MGETIKMVPLNIFEVGTVIVHEGTYILLGEDDGYSVERLWDRSKNFYWKKTQQAFKPIFEVDYGAAVSIDFLYVAGHNFDGITLRWHYSDDGAAWTAFKTNWLQADNDPIALLESTPGSHRWWRFGAWDNHDNPIVSEIFMGLSYSFDVKAEPNPAHVIQDNVTWSMSVGGQERSIKNADQQARVNYSLKLDASDLANLDTVIGLLDNFSLPLLVKDKDDTWRIMKFDATPTKTYFDPDLTEIDISMIEML